MPKRKRTETVAEPQAKGTVIDFEKIITDSNIVPANSMTDTDRNRGEGGQADVLERPASFLGVRLSDDDLAIHVPSAIKEQIVTGQYVNLALLLKGPSELAVFTSGGVLTLAADGSLQTKPKECKDKVPNIEKWTDAFLMFASIYLKHHPHKMQELLQYMFNIRESAI